MSAVVVELATGLVSAIPAQPLGVLQARAAQEAMPAQRYPGRPKGWAVPTVVPRSGPAARLAADEDATIIHPGHGTTAEVSIAATALNRVRVSNNAITVDGQQTSARLTGVLP